MPEAHHSAMEGPEWEKLSCHLEAGEFAAAAQALDRLMPVVQSADERLTCYQLLASSYWLASHRDPAGGYRARVRQTYEAALREFPRNPTLRNALGLFILMDESNPVAALPYLEPVPGQEVAAEDEQRRQALRGVTLALLGSVEESMESLLRAYGGAFPEAIQDPDTSPLVILVKRGVKMPRAGVTDLIRILKQYPAADPDNLEELRGQLAG